MRLKTVNVVYIAGAPDVTGKTNHLSGAASPTVGLGAGDMKKRCFI